MTCVITATKAVEVVVVVDNEVAVVVETEVVVKVVVRVWKEDSVVVTVR